MRSTVVPLREARSRDPRLSRAIAARRRLSRSAEHAPSTGRVWVNGREMGGPDPRYAHLADSHD
jgi:hypothetical protein